MSTLSALGTGEASEVSDLVVQSSPLMLNEVGVGVIESTVRTPWVLMSAREELSSWMLLNEVEMSDVELVVESAAKLSWVSKLLMSACEELWMLSDEVEVSEAEFKLVVESAAKSSWVSELLMSAHEELWMLSDEVEVSEAELVARL